MRVKSEKKVSPNNNKLIPQMKFIKHCPISKIKPFKDNPRRNIKAIEAVVKSIEAHGFIAPIIINEQYELCAGHTRIKSANELNIKAVPAIMVTGLSGDRFISYNIADNQTASIANWDDEKLMVLIQRLDESEPFDVKAIGFSDLDLQRLLSSQYRRDWYRNNKDKFKGYRDDNPEKIKARRMVNKAIADETLIRGCCESCSTTKNIHGHHDDYSKPLDVRWFCVDCHGIETRETQIESGDQWQLGNHVLACGDDVDTADAIINFWENYTSQKAAKI